MPIILEMFERFAARVLVVKQTIRVSREKTEALIIDATEQPIHRPQSKQRCWYFKPLEYIKLSDLC